MTFKAWLSQQIKHDLTLLFYKTVGKCLHSSTHSKLVYLLKQLILLGIRHSRLMAGSRENAKWDPSALQGIICLLQTRAYLFPLLHKSPVLSNYTNGQVQLVMLHPNTSCRAGAPSRIKYLERWGWRRVVRHKQQGELSLQLFSSRSTVECIA